MSPVQFFIQSTNICSMPGTEHKQDRIHRVSDWELAVVVFKQPLEARLPTVLYFSRLSLMATLPQHESWDISLQGGTEPFAQLCKCSERHTRRVGGISSPCVSAPQPSACPFPVPWKTGAVLAPTSPHSPITVPIHRPRRFSPHTFAYPFPVQAFLQ